MRLSKLSVRNFRNFKAIDIPLSGDVVLLGENAIGKSNLLFAIQLILDPMLPDAARQLRLSDFFDAKAPIAAEAVKRIDVLFAIEREINGLAPEVRLRVRQERSRTVSVELEAWLRGQRA